MEKLRNRILHTLLLATLSLTMLGTTAEAAKRLGRGTASITPPRPVAAPSAGEPDLTGQTVPSPPKIDRASMRPAGEEAGDTSFHAWTRLWLSQFLKRRI